MTAVSSSSNGSARRRRGSVRAHRAGFQVRVAAGTDPSTGERIVLVETHPDERAAERARTRMLAEVDALKTARTKADLGYLLDGWLDGHEVAVTTRVTYEILIRNHIRPALGVVSLAKLHRSAAEILEGFYGELRRCSGAAIGGRSSSTGPRVNTTVRRGAAGRTGAGRYRRRVSVRSTRSSAVRSAPPCAGAGCRSIRPRLRVLRPRSGRSHIRPAFVMPPALPKRPGGVMTSGACIVWLAMVTGARRGELLALR